MTLSAPAILSQHDDLSTARRAMIDSQLRVSGINQDWLLAALARVPREDYVPASARGHAYIDRAIPLDHGHALPAPLVQAMLLAEAAPQADDAVLVVSQTGYLSALVEPLVQSVETVDAAGALALQLKARFSLILIDGAIEALPGNLVSALRGGSRVVTGLVLRGVTRVASGVESGGTVELNPLAEIGIPVLSEFAAPKAWSF
jgi:protein-L-isoaspartate(D-aspartate) O-methyltransferase